jgi:tRNA uridine 5-carbamoylmethylation protein Kti12
MKIYKNTNLSRSVIVVSGPPGVGKTTTLKIICQKLPKAAHISVDKLRKFVGAGYYCSPDRWTKSVEKQYKLAHKNVVDLVKNFCDEGYTVFIDDVFQNQWKEDLKNSLKNCKFYFIFLSANLKTVLKRNQLRKKYAVKKSVVKLLHKKLFEENTENQDWIIINNENLNAQATATKILKILVS